MAKQSGNEASQFNARSDRAALSLRQQLQQRGASIPDSRGVQVDANGRPPAQLPPEGSYARQALEAQRQAAATRQAGQLQQDDDIQMQPQDPQATLQGDPASGQPNAMPTAEEQAQLSANAQRRISQLTEDLRRKDQELQRILQEAERNKSSLGELEAKLDALSAQHSQLLQNSLDTMDPDTRTQVLLDGRLHEAIAASEQRLMSQILPHLKALDRQAIDAEIRQLAAKYPGFQVDIHGPLIETFRQSNPRCTVEQAFRAVAEPEELQLAPQVRASAVPPAVRPGNGRVQSRYVEQRQSNPEDELVEEARQLQKLMRSTDPDDKSKQQRALHEHLSRRLDSRLPR